MHGHGSPIIAPQRGRGLHWRFRLGLCFVLLCVWAPSGRAEISLRLQMAWGGPTERLWRGAIRLPQGRLEDIRLLGLDADQPGTFVLQENRILIEPRRPNRYSGLEVTVQTDYDDEQLEIILTPDLDHAQERVIRIPIASLRASGYEQSLGENQKLRIARAAGDSLRVGFARDALVFDVGERVLMDVVPNQLELKADTPLRLRLRLKQAKPDRNDVAEFWTQDEVIWSTHQEVRSDQQGELAATEFEIPMPAAEGVYELTVDLVHKPLTVKPPLAKRQVQFVVIDSRQPALFGDRPATEVTNFNPAVPKWFEQLPQWTLIPRANKGPWSNLEIEAEQAEGEPWTRLRGDQWVAYSLPVSDLNVPHLLEIEFPPNSAQDVSVSLFQQNVSRSLVPAGLHSGVTMGDPDLELLTADATTEPTKHRLVFWPRTSSPVVVIANQHAARPALFGELRLVAYKQGLPVTPTGPRSSRKRIAMLTRPLLKQMFLAKDGFDERNFSFDDWTTFYQSGSRLVEYLRFAGYDGVSLAALAEGSSLYPSQILYPTPKYDRGVYANTGQDPLRKDVLEMLFRLFDREGLLLIPGIEFAGPLPELEAQLARGGPNALGIELVGQREPATGTPSADTPAARLPYYNPLNDYVQAAMIAVVGELVNRYGHHASFAGVNLPTTAETYLHLAQWNWGLDPNTLEQFVRESSPQDDEVAAELLKQLPVAMGTPSRPTAVVQRWLKWRADRLSQLYRQMARRVAAAGDTQRRLYLSMRGLSKPAPGGSAPPSTQDLLLELGIDTVALAKTPSLTLVRSHEIAPLANLEVLAQQLETGAVLDLPSSHWSCSQFYHQPQSVRLQQFDAKELKLTDASATLSWKAQFATAGQRGRSFLAHSLAQHDDRLVFEGGRAVPLGQEAATRSYFEVFRQLPDRPFKTIKFDLSPPVAVRVAADDNETVAYFVNDSPWQATVLIEWRTPQACSISPIGPIAFAKTERPDRSTGYGTARLEPYGLFALRFSSPRATVTGCRTDLPTGIAKQLLDQYDEIAMRAEEVKKRSGSSGLASQQPRALTAAERFELSKILTAAYTQQSKNDLAGWYRTLSGYWPRYLLRHVPAPRLAVQPRPAVRRQPAAKPPAKMLDRLRRFVPPSLRF